MAHRVALLALIVLSGCATRPTYKELLAKAGHDPSDSRADSLVLMMFNPQTGQPVEGAKVAFNAGITLSVPYGDNAKLTTANNAVAFEAKTNQNGFFTIPVLPEFIQENP